MKETKSHAKRRRVAKRLRRFHAAGRVTVDQVALLTARGPRAVASWIAGTNLPPSTVLPRLVEVLMGER